MVSAKGSLQPYPPEIDTLEAFASCAASKQYDIGRNSNGGK